MSGYLEMVERRILSDEWRVGWFRVERDVEIDGLRCSLLFYGHSMYFKTRPFLLSMLQLPFVYPYGAAAILFVVKEATLDFIEKVIRAVRSFMERARMKLPGGREWGVDVAFVAVASEEGVSRDLAEWVEALKPDVYDQWMQEPWFGRAINKKIGLTLIDLKNKVAYSAKNVFAAEAKRLFSPKPALVEKIKWAFRRRKGG
ncbi:hypothetical protein B6U99_06275 [Candidatus Geothermarchaeota archaeon ex4572_27]|nr:MAG: hypothetical protein B6U99_06275 [Candidatus Geothermarchaeota archaeon ex4572_27]